MESEQHFHTWPLWDWASLPLMTRKKPRSRQAAPGRRGRTARQFPSGPPGFCSAKTARGCQSSPKVPKQPEGAKTTGGCQNNRRVPIAASCSRSSPEERIPRKQSCAHAPAEPPALEGSAEQGEAANTNFPRVNTYNCILADISKAAWREWMPSAH